ncbi:DUF2341 domain-containing protein [Bacteroidota bacterium]
MKNRIYAILVFIAAFSMWSNNIFAQNPGNALDFDGSNDYVTIPDAAALDITDQITLEGWFKSASSSWVYKKSITVNHTKVSATLSDFPVLVSVTDTDLKDTDNGGSIQPDGDDILFKGTDGTILPHEIEEYNGSTGLLRAWIKIPSLSSSADTEFYIYYGNSSCSSQQDKANVWDSNFKGVWHLEESGNGTVGEFKDGTGNNNNGRGGSGNASRVPAQTSSGKIGNAQIFDSSDDHIYVPDSASLRVTGDITISAWVKRAGTGSYKTMVSKGASASSWDYCFYFGGGDALDQLVLWADGTSTDFGEPAVWSGSTVTGTDWHHVAITRSGTTAIFYIDGAYTSGPFSMVGTFNSSTDPLWIGADGNGSAPLAGTLDELRISSTTRDSAWIGTEFRNQSSPGTFLSLEATQTFIGISKYSAYGISTNNTNAYAKINDQIVSGSINEGEWNHITLTYNKDAGGTDEMKLYINGTETATADYSTAISSNSSDLILADMAGFVGLLDEVRIWNDVRTEQEIRDYMHRVVTPASESNLVAYWQFNESSGTSASDSKGSNTGTLTNMTDGDWVTSPAPFGGGLVNTTTSFTSGTTDLGTLSLTTTNSFDNPVDITSTEILNEPNTLPSVGTTLDDRYWVVDVFGTPGTYTANLTFTLPPGYLELGDEANLKLYNRTSNSDGSWNLLISGATSMTETTVTFNGVSTLGQFTMTGSAFPMPVELTSFTGAFESGNITLRWRTETEVNNYGFEIERNTSEDPSNGDWEIIDFVTGYGNSNSPKQYSYTDNQISSSGTYHYRLKQIDFDGTFEYSPQVDVEVDVSHKFVLHQNYPNPFNPSTKISFEVPSEMRVKVTIYNILGEVVEVLANDIYEPGSHELIFDGGRLAAGVYCYSLRAGNNRLMGKMLLLK